MQAVSSSQAQSQPQQQHTDVAWLWKFIAAHIYATLGAVLCGIAAGITTAVGSYLIGVIIDHVRVQVEMGEILRYTLLLVGLTTISTLAFYGQRMFSGYDQIFAAAVG